MNKQLITVYVPVSWKEKLPPIKKQVVIKDTSSGSIYIDHTSVGWDRVTDYEWFEEKQGILLTKEEWDTVEQELGSLKRERTELETTSHSEIERLKAEIERLQKRLDFHLSNGYL